MALSNVRNIDSGDTSLNEATVKQRIADAGIDITPRTYFNVEISSQDYHCPETPIYSWYEKKDFSFHLLPAGFFGLVLMALSSLALYSSIPYAPALLLLGITLILVALVIATTGECILPKKETWVDYHITRHSGLWKKLQVSEDDERKIDALIAQFGNNILFQIHAQNAYRKRLPLNIPKHTRGTTVCDLELVLNNWIKIPINCWTVVH